MHADAGLWSHGAVCTQTQGPPLNKKEVERIAAEALAEHFGNPTAAFSSVISAALSSDDDLSSALAPVRPSDTRQ